MIASAVDFSVFKNRLSGAQLKTEQALSHWLPKPSGHQAVIMDAMRYAALGGGKRIRPFLLTETAKLFGVDDESVWGAASALECVHVYSLIHDDLPCMDDDDLRRGKPTVHIAYDEAIAVLAGDGLLTQAFEILGSLDVSAEARVMLIQGLAKAAGTQGMIGGQVIDIKADETTRNQALISELQNLKTGALIRYAVEAGTILGGASSEQTENLLAYADDLGLIFQITDDILDVEGDATRLGKAVQKDENLGKATFVSILGLEGAREKARNLSTRAKGRLEPFGQKAQILVDTVDYILVRDQ